MNGWRMAASLLLLAGSLAAGDLIDRKIIEDPRHIDLDAASETRWERLYSPEQRWTGRDLAFLEARHPELILSLLSARLLYRGGPWSRRIFVGAGDRWKNADREVRLAVLRCLRYHREPVLGDVYCAFLSQETDVQLASQALINLQIIDPPTALSWALRLADPRHASRLPASQHEGVRSQALVLLVETRGPDADEVRPPLTWTLLNAGGSERNRALRLLPRGAVPDLLVQLVVRLAKDHRDGVLDEDGRFGLVLAMTRLTGSVNRDQLAALLHLAIKGDRALAAAATTALTTGVTWDSAIVINDLVDRVAGTEDAAMRHILLALLVRLDASLVSRAAVAGSPWMRLADHVNRLQEWDDERAAK